MIARHNVVAVSPYKIRTKMCRSFKGIENIHKKGDRPHRNLGYLSLISDLIRSGKRSQIGILKRQSSQRHDILVIEILLKYFIFVQKMNLIVCH